MSGVGVNINGSRSQETRNDLSHKLAHRVGRNSVRIPGASFVANQQMLCLLSR